MKSKLITGTIAALILAIGSHGALAESDGDYGRDHDRNQQETAINYAGPADIAKVSELSSRGGWFTDDHVIMEGKLIKQIDAETFMFEDSSGEILLSMEDDMPNIHVTASDLVRVFGHYEGFWGKPKIEAERIAVLTP